MQLLIDGICSEALLEVVQLNVELAWLLLKSFDLRGQVIHFITKLQMSIFKALPFNLQGIDLLLVLNVFF